MTVTRRKFDKDFYLQAVKMIKDSGLSKAEVGRKLGISPAVIGNWVRRFQEDGSVAFPGDGRLNARDQEIENLRKMVREQEQEVAFLKKTSAYFANLKK